MSSINDNNRDAVIGHCSLCNDVIFSDEAHSVQRDIHISCMKEEFNMSPDEELNVLSLNHALGIDEDEDDETTLWEDMEDLTESEQEMMLSVLNEELMEDENGKKRSKKNGEPVLEGEPVRTDKDRAEERHSNEIC